MSIIVMSDDDFEENMQFIASQFNSVLADSFRARDTAQREALARVEAERDNARCVVANLLLERDTDQAQLADAVLCLQAFVDEWDGLLDDEAQMHYVGNARDFLARHAQAEQQEACESEWKLSHVAIVNSHATGEFSQQEAHGAQAADERAAFEAWTRVHNESLKDDCPDRSEDIKLDRQAGVYCWSNTDCAWQAWKARAALATQPDTEQLWAVHAQGPDDLYAAFSREEAEAHAAALNAIPCPPGISVSAVVIESPWPAASHWKYLVEQDREHNSAAERGAEE